MEPELRSRSRSRSASRRAASRTAASRTAASRRGNDSDLEKCIRENQDLGTEVIRSILLKSKNISRATNEMSRKTRLEKLKKNCSKYGFDVSKYPQFKEGGKTKRNKRKARKTSKKRKPMFSWF